MTLSTHERDAAGGANSAVDLHLPLLYHELRPEPAAYSYVLPCGRFAEHLRLFAQLRQESYRPLITFDDGHVSNREYALPMLGEASVRAHFFITAGWTGTRAAYMEPKHLRELYEAGHTIGAHGWSHALLTQCDDAALRRELGEAKAALEGWIGAPITSLSLPGGRGNARVLRACREAGYATVWTSTPGVTRSVEPVVGRYNILASISDDELVRLLDPASGALRRAGGVSRAKAALQRMLGDRMYARLWSAVNRQEAEATEPGEAPKGAREGAAG